MLAAALVVGMVMSPAPSRAQAPASAPTSAASSQDAQSPGDEPDDEAALRFRTPTITVTAQKTEEDRQEVPVSVTAVSGEAIERAGFRIVSDAVLHAPNVFYTEFTARKLSTARVRGVGSSPNNPGVTTYIDGVPQLNESSASLELLDVGQIEFVRGPQGALFGRNTLGGLVNVTTARPSLDSWTGTLSAPFGNYNAWAVRGGASGPVVTDRLSLGVSFAEVNRDGFTVNDVTGRDIDSRSAFSSKAQLLWTPSSTWETRFIVTSERSRDGDFGLHDVGALRARPFHVARDFEGSTDRDVLGTTIQVRHRGDSFEFASTTGIVDWTTRDRTDLDYTPFPLVTRDNTETAVQFTQEVHLASTDAAAIRLSDQVNLGWQTGVFFFTQGYEQDAINAFAPQLVAPFAVAQHAPRSTLDDVGVGIFGQGTVTIRDRLDLSAGARVDYEDKQATLETFFDPMVAPPSRVEGEESFANVSPQASVAYRVQPDQTLYGSVGRGYKAGGFNAASPLGSEAYGEERTWHVEGGAKSLWAGGRVSTNAAVFYIDWQDLQLNVPHPAVPAQFFIANVGDAVSKGVELEVNARAAEGIDLFSAVGYTHARFSQGSVSSGVSVGGNTIPNTPEYTASAGLQYARPVGPATVHGRADVVFYGAFQYDDANTMAQDAYSLVNLRLGVTGRFLAGEVFVRNVFDTQYIPVAFPYPVFAPSGFVGEMGAPRTVGVSGTVRF
jgi:iron complex outermembrane receptor protein